MTNMEMRAGNFKWLVGHLNAEDSPLGLSLSRRYADELQADDDAIIRFKDLQDNGRILTATKDFTPTQKRSAGIEGMGISVRIPPPTRIQNPFIRMMSAQRPSLVKGSDFTATTQSSPHTSQNDSDEKSEEAEDGEDYDSYRFSCLQKADMGEDLTYDQYLQFQADFGGSIPGRRSFQKINLKLPRSAEVRLQRYKNQPLGAPGANERQAVNKICDDVALDCVTAQTFLCLFIELRGQNRIALETRFMSPFQHISSLRPTLLFRGEYVHKSNVPEECKVMLAPCFEDGRWSLLVLDMEPGVARFYDSVVQGECSLASGVEQYYELYDGQERIVACPPEPDFEASGIFMLLNAIAYLNDVVVQDFYDSSNILGIRKWLAMVMVMKKIPADYGFRV